MNYFEQLHDKIIFIHDQIQAKAIHTINHSLTIRNLLIGMYIVEFEQKGQDRAQYGTKLLNKLAKSINIKGLIAPELSRCRQFYNCYPQIFGSLTQEFKYLLPESILGSLTQELSFSGVRLTSHMAKRNMKMPLIKIVTKLSYTHIIELIKIPDDLKRSFYEVECIKGTWSVRELKRQIASLYYERSGLSEKPENLSDMYNQTLILNMPLILLKISMHLSF